MKTAIYMELTCLYNDPQQLDRMLWKVDLIYTVLPNT